MNRHLNAMPFILCALACLNAYAADAGSLLVALPSDGPWSIRMEIAFSNSEKKEVFYLARRDEAVSWLEENQELPVMVSTIVPRGTLLDGAVYKRIDLSLSVNGILARVLYADNAIRETILSPDILRGNAEFVGGITISHINTMRTNAHGPVLSPPPRVVPKPQSDP